MIRGCTCEKISPYHQLKSHYDQYGEYYHTDEALAYSIDLNLTNAYPVSNTSSSLPYSNNATSKFYRLRGVLVVVCLA